MEDRRRETGDIGDGRYWRQETGVGGQEMKERRQETGDGRQEIGYRRWKTADGRRKKINRKGFSDAISEKLALII